MEQTQNIVPKKRINSIDSLRGFALLGILLFHCLEHFDLAYTPILSSPFLQSVDNIVLVTITFLFAGKSYAIFSLLFGLSFFMQMDSQADKGVDFRLRFLWRLTILLFLGYLNGLIYMGEFFFVYAVVGILIIPLYKVSTKWLVVLLILLLIQIPDIINFVSLLSGNAPNEPTSLVKYMDELYAEAIDVFANGSFSDVLTFNAWKGLTAKMLWVLVYARYPQLLGLFIVGMLIGRLGIYKSEEKMVKYSSKVLPYSIVGFVIFYSVVLLLPHFVNGFTLNVGTTLFKAYANLNMMMMYICTLILLYYKTKTRKILDYIAPVGRMSVTNYMIQSFVGVILFYGFGANLAMQLSFLQCLLLGLVIYIIQVVYSNWWMQRYYYGPIEWLWRTVTWFKSVPFIRK